MFKYFPLFQVVFPGSFVQISKGTRKNHICDSFLILIHLRLGSALEASCGKDLGVQHFGATLTDNSPSYVLFIIHMKDTALDPPKCW